ncbi:hypothetical protein [Sporohalobacter salinus]|uniref:hypothetical protein n=1 Tax=Sporohalobacter salinus TaxID=1494606 RepID=UPI00195F849F|nr:hypothetical protein [Sporohalobacter salinus]MBM7625137.1 uncharacterized membrane protein HdeD (DUF308 family) [Sporohalobacter salinus]
MFGRIGTFIDRRMEVASNFVIENKSILVIILLLIIFLPILVFILFNFGDISKIIKNIKIITLAFSLTFIMFFIIFGVGGLLSFNKRSFRKKCWYIIFFGALMLIEGLLRQISLIQDHLVVGIYMAIGAIISSYYLQEKYRK